MKALQWGECTRIVRHRIQQLPLSAQPAVPSRDRPGRGFHEHADGPDPGVPAGAGRQHHRYRLVLHRVDALPHPCAGVRRLADVIGQLRVILLGSLTGVLTFAVYALAPSWQAALLGPALLAITMALTFPAFYSYVAERSQDGTPLPAFPIAQTVRNLAWVVSPPLGGLLGQAFGYRGMFVAASAIFGPAAVIFLILNRTGQSLNLREQPRLSSLRVSLNQLARF